MAETTFEKSIKELDEIVKKLELGELSLDEMLALFERGISLSKTCNKLLNEAEKKVNILIKKDDGVQKQQFSSSEGEL
ncbi:MAG: exodeoxyribonuclease VII small subunit [Firmicutes bacterium]|nr:exodeoxyribonuclease VII small subunit [Bacillota bacterium]